MNKKSHSISPSLIWLHSSLSLISLWIFFSQFLFVASSFSMWELHFHRNSAYSSRPIALIHQPSIATKLSLVSLTSLWSSYLLLEAHWFTRFDPLLAGLTNQRLEFSIKLDHSTRSSKDAQLVHGPKLKYNFNMLTMKSRMWWNHQTMRITFVHVSTDYHERLLL